jgi:hypothetical protein
MEKLVGKLGSSFKGVTAIGKVDRLQST